MAQQKEQSSVFTEAERAQKILNQINTVVVPSTDSNQTVNVMEALNAIENEIRPIEQRQILIHQLSDSQRFKDYTLSSIRFIPGYAEALHLLGKTGGILDYGNQTYYVTKVESPFHLLRGLVSDIKSSLQTGVTEYQTLNIPKHIFGDELNGWQFGRESDEVTYAKTHLALIMGQILGQVDDARNFTEPKKLAERIRSYGLFIRNIDDCSWIFCCYSNV